MHAMHIRTFASAIAAALLLVSASAQQSYWASGDDKTGSEHAIGKDKSQPNAKVCQVWTDTWLKRGGTWHIIASHDNRVKCR